MGIPKLDPRNVAWLTHNDQITHWIGWRFFAQSGWQWPPGANFKYGWESSTSIIATDSWPLFAVIFKLLQIPVVSQGQYFGFGYLVGAILLTFGSARLLSIFGLGGVRRFLGIVIMITIPMFWYMHRWYPALSAGMALLVWATCLYFEDMRRARISITRWTLLLSIGVATQFYLFALLLVFYVVTTLEGRRRGFSKSHALASSVLVLVFILAIMYLLGYFMIPITRASAGSGYGEFSANLLAPIDPGGASGWISRFPSTDQQYEPTFVGMGALLLLCILLMRHRVALWQSVRGFSRNHIILGLALVMMSAFAISHVVTVGTVSLRVPIPLVVEQSLSVFRSSVRFIWPLILMIVLGVVVLVSRLSPKAIPLLMLVAIVQIADIAVPIRSVAERPNGNAIGIRFDKALWARVPSDYSQIAQHPAANYKGGWAECAYAALATNRAAQCAYLARVLRLTELNQQNQSLLQNEVPSVETVYWFDFGWITTNADLLRSRYSNGRHGFVVLPSGVLMFPDCQRFGDCQFLHGIRQSVEDVIASANS